MIHETSSNRKIHYVRSVRNNKKKKNSVQILHKVKKKKIFFL